MGATGAGCGDHGREREKERCANYLRSREEEEEEEDEEEEEEEEEIVIEEEVRKRGRLLPKRQKRRVGPAVYNA